MPIINDTTSDCTRLKESAWRALQNIRHPFVREFSILHMYDEIETALPVFIANYQTQDEEQLVTLVKSIPIDFKCTTAWHGIHLDVFHMVDNRLKAPASLLYHIYENTYCSCCREYALRQMGKRRLLTDDILQECLLDSNEDIRIYAKRCLNRRKSNIQKVSNHIN